METSSHLTTLVMIFVALGIAFGLVAISVFLGPKRPNKTKQQVWECGSEPIGKAKSRLPVQYHTVAILFLIFDVEAVFILPWAVLFRDYLNSSSQLAFFVVAEMVAFMGLLTVGLIYIWRKGALEW